MRTPCSTSTTPFSAPLSPIAQLQRQLSPEAQVMLRKISSALSMPVDAPGLRAVISIANHAVRAYGAVLSAPTAQFIAIVELLEMLKNECEKHFLQCLDPADAPLRRRLIKNSAWALMLEMSRLPVPKGLLVAAGVELAYCLAIGKVFPAGYAKNLRRALGPALDFLPAAAQTKDGEAAWIPHFRKVGRAAIKIFEAAPQPPEPPQSFRDVAIKTLRGTSLLTDTRHRQGVLDHSHLSQLVLVEAAQSLRHAAIAGCDDAVLAVLTFLSGLSLRTTHRIPLAGESDDWVMELDVDEGILRIDLDLVFSNAAHPRDASTHRPAGRIIAKPLPVFLADILTKRLDAAPSALFVHELLPAATCDGKRLALHNDALGIEPSIARFVRSAAGFAIQRGADRLAAAVLANDFGVIPASKLYYCHIERGEVWEVARIIYENLGWGAPAPYSEGMSFGSRVAPTRAAVAEWHATLCNDLELLDPGRNAGIESICSFHNRYAEACASITVFCLASRGTARIRLTADALTEDAESILLFDKRVGNLPRPLPVPVNAVVARQAKLWGTHCKALERRLATKGIAPDHELRRRLQAIVKQERVEIFFQVDKELRPRPLSCHQLVRAGSKDYGFESDFGRHFWELELRRAGVQSTTIDLLLRHQVQGIEGHRSTTDRSLMSSFLEIVTAQERVLTELGVAAHVGLSKK